MLYRNFQTTGDKVSLLGLGAMRFPMTKDGKVDEAESIRMIRHAIDSGINYVDTAYTYHGGTSEVIVGKALKDGYRERTFIADKLPIWLVKEEADVRKFFDEQIQRLDVNCIDMYLIHCIDKDGWEVTKKCRVIEILEELKAEGKIGRIGFSFHDELSLFKEVIDAYDWEFCQIQLNYVDVNFQAGMEGLLYANAKGIPVVIMEPLKGGRLSDAVPPVVQKLWDQASVKRAPAEWAFKWVASHPDVATILSGMSTMEQLDQNLELFSREDLPVLTDEENALIAQAADLYRTLIKYPCTECKYCQPCPNGVLIPRIIRYYNDWCAYEHNPKLKEEYLVWQDESEHASNCIKCGACEEHCPQHLPVMQIMDEIVEAFGR
ncbi:MAG: aldo/keto reductase [Clostridiales bacterium]|nr:aldo/keto reductase [Clostridiales bacterium]